MAKEKIKKALGVERDFHLVDTHRTLPKNQGGEYIAGNVAIMEPVEHMKEHGIYREREEQYQAIKEMMDDRRQVMKLFMKINNQLMAYERNSDTLNQMTVEWLKRQQEDVKDELKNREKLIEKKIKSFAKVDNVTRAALSLKGCGYITVANLITYIDLEKARHASSLWSYVGLDKPSHERYTKGEAGGGNKTLRSALYVWAGVQIKMGGAYREVYDNTKHRLENSSKIVKTRNTQGKLVELPWSETKPSHRHGAAIRKMIKSFLADYWIVGRTIKGLPTDALYAESILGGNHRTVMPIERGWTY